MNFLSIRYFLMTAEERSITRAAEKLHITQQTLSAHIAAMEREAGAKLFVRSVPLKLTGSGEVFYRYAAMFVRTERDFRRDLSDASGHHTGTLRIGISPCRGRVNMPGMINAFQERCPLVNIHLFELSNRNIWNALRHDEIDVAMGYLPGEIPGIAHVPWMEEDILLLIEKNLAGEVFGESLGDYFYGNTANCSGIPPELSKCPFLLNSEEDVIGALARKMFRDVGMLPRISVESENMEVLLRLCLLGKGALFIPRNMAEKLLNREEKKKLLFLSFDEENYMMSFGCRKSEKPWAVINEWIETCRSVSGEGKA